MIQAPRAELGRVPTADVLNDKRQGPDENRGRLNDLWRFFAESRDPQAILGNAVLVTLGAPIRWSNNPPQRVDPKLAPMLAQLAVTGRAAYTKFAQWRPQDADVVQLVRQLPGGQTFDAVQLQGAASSILDTAYATLWAIRANDVGWKAYRSRLGWMQHQVRTIYRTGR